MVFLDVINTTFTLAACEVSDHVISNITKVIKGLWCVQLDLDDKTTNLNTNVYFHPRPI